MLSCYGRAMATKVQPLLLQLLDRAHALGAEQGYLPCDPEVVGRFYPQLMREPESRRALRRALREHVMPVLAEKRRLLLRPGVALMRTVEALQMRHTEEPAFATLVLHTELLRQHHSAARDAVVAE